MRILKFTRQQLYSALRGTPFPEDFAGPGSSTKTKRCMWTDIRPFILLPNRSTKEDVHREICGNLSAFVPCPGEAPDHRGLLQFAR
jgi:hypothetical protein